MVVKTFDQRGVHGLLRADEFVAVLAALTVEGALAIVADSAQGYFMDSNEVFYPLFVCACGLFFLKSVDIV